jgi:hypothetical protein
MGAYIISKKGAIKLLSELNNFVYNAIDYEVSYIALFGGCKQ